MSLEEALNRNSTAIETNNKLLETLLSKAPGTATAIGATGAAADKAADKAASKAAKETTKKLTLDDVKPPIAEWLGEFPKDGDADHPETTARKVALKNFFGVLKVGKLTDVTKAEDFAKLQTWITEQKAKGRLAPDAETSEDDDMGL